MKKYGLIGKSLVHSFSKQYFEQKFRIEKLRNASYDLIEIPDLSQVRSLLFESGYAGVNVTIPYKSEIFKYCDNHTPVAQSTNAINCIRVSNHSLTGHNTDVGGFITLIQPYIKDYPQKALILGNGGAAAAVKTAFQNLEIAYTVISRKAELNTLSWVELSYLELDNYDFIVHCTPLGTYPAMNEKPEFPYEKIIAGQICIDLIYNPPKSLFLASCEAQGAIIINGYKMLVSQAELSWGFWTKIEE